MKFLMVSDDGAGCGLALRIAEEGNEIAVAIEDPFGLHVCDGLVQKIESRKFTPDKDTVIIFDSTGMGWMADHFARAGYPVCCGSSLMDQLENDRRFAFHLIRKLGMEQPRSWFFNDWKTAREFVSESGRELRLVFKPCGESSGNIPSYVSADSEDLLGMLRYYEHDFPAIRDFMLQEFIEGVEVDTAIWFSRGALLLPADRTLESKQLMDGGRGESGGCTGNILYACDWDRIAQAQLDKFLPWAKDEGFTGILQVNSIATPDSVYILELTPRLGYDSEPTIFNELFDGEIGKFFSDLALGQSEDMPLKSGFAGGIKLSIPPWPSARAHAPRGIPLRGVAGFDHFYPYDIERDQEGKLFSAGGEGKIGIATGLADTIPGAMAEAYKVAGGVILPDVQYRGDLAELFEKRSKAIKDLD